MTFKGRAFLEPELPAYSDKLIFTMTHIVAPAKDNKCLLPHADNNRYRIEHRARYIIRLLDKDERPNKRLKYKVTYEGIDGYDCHLFLSVGCFNRIKLKRLHGIGWLFRDKRFDTIATSVITTIIIYFILRIIGGK